MKKKNLLMTVIAIFGLATITMAQIPSYMPTNGLVGWWPFNGNANDESGNGNNGTSYGPILKSDRFTIPSSAYEFDGVDDWIEIQNNSTFFNDTITISVWGKFKPINGFHITYSSSSDGSFVYSSSAIGGHTNTNLGCGGYGGIGNFISNLDTNWHNLTTVISGNLTNFYLDGLFSSSWSNSIITCNSINNKLYFGVDIFGSPEYSLGIYDDIGFWNRALTAQEITDLYIGCQLTINSQPTNQPVNINNSAQFVVSSSDLLANYQWQTDLGVGFQNLNSVGQYSGTANDTLDIANVTLSNNNQPFRCIVSSGSCSDTSAVAILTVLNNTGINEVSQSNLFSVYPNPANSQINVKADAKLLGSVYNIYDNVGKVVLSGKINSENTVIELGNLSGSIYLFSIGENLKQTFKVIKE
jgi:Concanavalin A-like lectin/glucanases superfamily/Secretion system C-terminal sorting domain